MLCLAMSDFSEWLRDNRLKAGLSLRQLERRINRACTFAYLDQLEKDVRGKKGRPLRPDLEIVDALARAFNQPKEEARRAAGYASKELDAHDLDDVRISFLDGSALTDEDKEEILRTIRRTVAGIKAEKNDE